MRLQITIILLMLCLSLNGSPRMFYNYSFFSENDKYMLLHHWELANTNTLLEDYDNLFTNERKCNAYFMLIEKKRGKVILKKGSSFFTYGWIDPNSEYIVLLSNISRFGSPHIALISIKGELLFKTRFWTEESVLSLKEYVSFKKKYPEYIKKLIKNDAISASNDLKTFYIQPSVEADNEKINKFLIKKLEKNHLSDCLEISTHPISSWFYLKFVLKPGIKFIAGIPRIKLKKSKSGNVLGISLLNTCEKRFIIPVTKKNKDGIHIPIKE
jgi:hypothetical protein